MSGSANRLSAEDRARNLVPVPLGDLRDAALTPPRFVIDPLLPRGVVTMLGGHGGSGKSILALTIAAHVAVGRQWSSFHLQQGRVLYVDMEDGAEFTPYRLRRVCDTYNINPDAVTESLTLLDGTRSDCSLASEISMDGVRLLAMTPVWTEVEEAAPGHCLIVIDNVSDAYSGNENERRQVRQFMRALGQLAREHDAAVLLLAHVDKHAARFGASGNSYSGSTGWHNSARSRLALTTTKDGGAELVHEKANHGKKARTLQLDWNDETGVLVAIALSETDKADQTTSDRDEVLDCIRTAIESGADVPTARVGPANTFIALRHHRDFPEWATQAGGKDRFWAGLNQLLAQKAIESTEYRNQDSKLRQRYEIRQSNPPLNPHTPTPRTGGTGGADSPIPPIPPNARTGGTGGTGGLNTADAYRAARDGDL